MNRIKLWNCGIEELEKYKKESDLHDIMILSFLIPLLGKVLRSNGEGAFYFSLYHPLGFSPRLPISASAFSRGDLTFYSPIITLHFIRHP